MNINELERLTGITKQNIRFYEKKELLHPIRNSTNNYREYSEDDLTTFKTIKLLRKLDFSLEDIHKILSEEISLHALLEQHIKELQDRQKKLNACIDVCKDLLATDNKSLNLDKTLAKIDNIEQNGGKFMSIIEDYKRYSQAQRKKGFAFKPDTMVMNATEFIEALTQYADENDQSLIFIKTGMYPVFELDGIEYKAQRVFDRFGATIHCTMTHPEEYDLKDISQKIKMLYRFINGPYLIMLIIFIFMAISRQSIGWTTLVAVMIFPYLFWMFWLFPKNRS